MLRPWTLAAVLCAALAAPAAAPAPDPPAAPAPGGPPSARSAPDGNLLANPGFEAGRTGWSYRDQSPYWHDFQVVDSRAHTGEKSVYLPVHAGADDPAAKVRVFGVVQELRPEPFPERFGGWYRVDRFEKDDEVTDLYLQAVVIVWGDPRTPEVINPLNPMHGLRNYQIRYYLAGQPDAPFRITNAKLRFVSRKPPARNEWVHFSVPLRRDFLEHWGVVPADYEMLRILFEARWDNRPDGSGVHADVYFDDLYLGTPPEDASEQPEADAPAVPPSGGGG